MEFLQVTDDALAQLRVNPNLPLLDLSLWHADVRAVICEADLLPALKDLVRELRMFLDTAEVVNQYKEEHWSGILGHIWNSFIGSVLQSPARSSDEPGEAAASSDGPFPYHSRRYALCSSMFLIHQMSLRDDITLHTCDLGASASGRCATPDLLARNLLRLIEVKKNLKLEQLLTKQTRYQAQAEMQHARVTNAHHDKVHRDIRQAFTMETLSNKACAWELMIPCHEEDALATMYPADGRGSTWALTRSQTSASAASETGEEHMYGKFVPVTLVTLENWPKSDQQLMSMYLGLLHLQLRLSMRYLDGNPCNSNGFKVPSTLVENLEYFVDPKAKNVLRYKVDRSQRDLSLQQRAAIVAVDTAVGESNWSGFVVKTFDYFYHSDSWLLHVDPKLKKFIQHDQRRRAPSEALCRLLLEHFGLAAVERGGDNCAIFITPWFEGKHVPKSWKQMVCVLELLLGAHSLGYAHGDMLPQNMVFATASDSAWVIDWDMARLETDDPAPTYVKGYNSSFEERHSCATAGGTIKRQHDCFSLAALINRWFEGGDMFASFAASLSKAAYLDADLLRAAQALLDEHVWLKTSALCAITMADIERSGIQTNAFY